MLVATLTLFLTNPETPIDRMYSFFESADHLSMTVAAGTQGRPAGGTAQYSWAWPSRQVLYQGNGDQRIEFRQNPKYIHVVEHGRKAYYEYAAPGTIVGPPEEAAVIAHMFPQFHTYIKRDVNREVPFSSAGKATRNGVEYDHVIAGEDGTTQDFFLDSMGRIRRIEYTVMGPSGPIDLFMEFSNYDISRASVKIISEIEAGYVPDRIPELHRTALAYDEAVLGNATNARNNKATDLDELRGQEAMAVLITSPRCVPSQEGESSWRKLESELKKKGCKFIEVVIDGKANVSKKGSRQIFEDSSESVAKAIAPPITPYIVLIDKGGIIRQAWAGYHADQESRMIKTFLERLE